MNHPTSHITPSLSELMKLEHLVAATGFSLLPKQPVNSILAGKHASKLRGRGLDFEEARKYVAGDDIRNIDWRVTARTRTTYTKVFTEEKEKPILIITDMTSGMFFGSQVYTKLLIATQLAAIAAFKTLKNSDRIGGLVFDNEDCKVFHPQRSRAAVMQYLQCLVSIGEKHLNNPGFVKSKATIYEQALRRVISMASHDNVILFISDFYGFSTQSKKNIIQLSRHNDVILAQVTDPLEAQLPNEKVVLTDGDLQLMWNSSSKKSGQKYQETYKNETESFLQDIGKYGIPIMPFNTTDNIDSQLKNLFKSKTKRR